jgi:hypothetical protein
MLRLHKLSFTGQELYPIGLSDRNEMGRIERQQRQTHSQVIDTKLLYPLKTTGCGHKEIDLGSGRYMTHKISTLAEYSAQWDIQERLDRMLRARVCATSIGNEKNALPHGLCPRLRHIW